MSKRRITLTLDEDLIEAIKQLGPKSISAAVNASLRETVEGELHRRALRAWLEELNAKYGEPSPEERAEAAAFLDSIGFGTPEAAVQESTADAA